MIHKRLFVNCLAVFLAWGGSLTATPAGINDCSMSKCDNTKTLTITDDVINPNYIGNGVEWDPYDEAESWGASLSEDDWQTLFARLDYMRPAYVRCMINSPFRYYDAEKGEYQSNRNTESLFRLLDYCRQRGIMVVYGEYNPPRWDMKEDQRWIDMSVDYLNMLVIKKGYDCIKHFVIFNEPDGDWASTNGDFEMWRKMLGRFYDKMRQYPGLLQKVSLAGPDVVADYKNPASEYDTAGWLEQTAADANDIIGLYDIHAYPGQAEVRSGNYRKLLKKYRSIVPEGKQIILGEAGYKYWRDADSLLMAEYNRRVEGHPYTKGSDCNMLVYDRFYGLDMPILISEVMNSGFSGVAAWMLDDAMHSQGDSGKPEDIKIWGMWNILGKEVFGDASQEEARPWYYTWSLMCRNFPGGSRVLNCRFDCDMPGVFAVAAKTPANKLTVALINVNDNPREIEIDFPSVLESAMIYQYSEKEGMELDNKNHPVASKQIINRNNLKINMNGNSMILITENQQ